MNQRNLFYKRGLASLVITTGVWLSPSPLFAVPITFGFGSIKDNTVSTFSQTVSGVTINNPQCVGGSGAIKFRTSTDGLNLEPVAKTKNGDCNSGSLSASQFDLSFDKPVQFSSYQSKAWDAGTYELVVNGTTVSTGNTVGTSTSATSSYAFASTPTLAAGTTATLKMVPLASPSQGGDGGKLKSITVDYQQSKSSQTISFGALGNKTYGDAAFSLAATVSSNLAVSYTATGSCTISGQTVTLTGAGQCTVTASQAGNDQFSAATAVVQSFTIAKATQTLSFTPAKEATLGQSLPLTATVAPPGLSVTFASTTTNVCTVSGTTVQFKEAGACQIKASQPGNDKYEAAPSVTATIMVYPETQTQILPNKVIGDTVALQANSTSGLPVTYSLAPTSQGCALQETTVTTVSVGTCVVILTQAGNATFYPARTEYRFDIVKGAQVITFTPPASVNAGEKLMLTTIGGASENPVTFASSPTNICTVKENTVSFLATGICTIIAKQAGNTNYNAATEVKANITVSTAPKTDQTISFSPALTGTVGTTANLTATASSGLAVAFASTTPRVCTIGGNVVSFVGTGWCNVTANQVGDYRFNAAKDVSATIVVSTTPKTDQTISFSPALMGKAGTTANLTGTASSNLAVAFASSPATVCTVSGNVVSFVSAGDCIVTANQVGNDKFNAAKEVSATVVVLAAQDQIISFSPVLTGTVGTTANLTATASSGLTAITFASSTLNICAVSSLDKYVYFWDVGTCTITANQAGNDKFNAAKEVSANIMVSYKTNQTISFSPALTAVAGTIANLTATASSNLPVIFESLSATTDCIVLNNRVIFSSAGTTCTVVAKQAGNDYFNAAKEVSATIVVSAAEQLIQLSTKLVKEKGITPVKAAATVLYNLPDEQAGSIAAAIAAAVLMAAPTLSVTLASEVTEAVLSSLNPDQAKKFAVEIAATVAQIVPQATAAIAVATTKVVPEMAVDIATALTIANPSKAIDIAIAVATANPYLIGPLAGELAKVVPNETNRLVTELAKLNPEAADQIVTSLIVEAGMDPVTALQLTLEAAPSQALNIAIATASAAPDQASQIAEALLRDTKNFPYQKIQELVVSAMVVAPELATTIVDLLNQIIKKYQVVTINSALYVTSGDTATLSATADSDLTPITFTSYPVEICEVAGENVTYKAEGTCTVVAKQAGNEQFNPVEQKVNVSVMSKGVFSLDFTDANDNFIFQAIEGDNLKISLTFKANANDVGKTAKFYLKAMAGNTALMLTDKGFVTATEPLQVLTSVTLLADQITLPLHTGALPAGKYSIYAAYQTADGKEEATSVFTVKGKQTVTFTNLPESAKVGEKVDLTLTGGGSNNPIVLTSTTADICTVQDKTVTFNAEGKCELQATQDGNEVLTSGIATGSISVKSAGVFSFSVTDKDGKAISEVIEKNTINIDVIFKASTDDIGKTTTFYLTVSKESNKWMFVNGKWVGVQQEPLQPVASNVLLTKDIATLHLYTGSLNPGKATFEVAYQTTDGKKVKAISVLNVISKLYSEAYATAKAKSKSDIYATAYATAIAKGGSKTYSLAYAKTYEDMIADGKSVGIASEIAAFYAKNVEYTGGELSPYEIAYEKAIEAGKSVDYAAAYAQAIDYNKSDAYATTYAKVYTDVYAEAKANGKPNATSYATAYATAYADVFAASSTITYVKAYATAYATAYTKALEGGETAAYAAAYATAIAKEAAKGK